MRLLHTPGVPRQRRSQTVRGVPRRADCAPTNEIEGRHDGEMLSPRRTATDPYAAWLTQREAEDDRARLDPRDAWEVLKTDVTFGMNSR